MGAIYAGALCCGIYTTSAPEAIEYIANHSRCQVLVVQDDKQMLKVLDIANNLPNLKAIVQYTGDIYWDADEDPPVPVYDWPAFMALGSDVPEYEVVARIEPQQPGHCCTLIYTSGTTGAPKVCWKSAQIQSP